MFYNRRQMYKIYINKTLIILKNTEDLGMADSTDSRASLVVHYTGKKKTLLNYIDMCEKSSRLTKIVIHYENYEQLKTDFLSHYEIVPAAGGLVMNELGELLFIFRRKHWDLPKGKLEKGESKKSAAVREVMEETGVINVDLISKLSVTDHTYKSKGKRLIKKSYWYLMKTEKQILIPQTAEDIEIAEWMNLESFYGEPRVVYPSIFEVLNAYQGWKIKNHLG